MDYRFDIPTYADDNKSLVNVVVEIPKGSYIKYEIDTENGASLNIVRTLSQSIGHKYNYPFNYGFIPSTLADDNDQLDVIILADEVIDPLTVLKCRVVGVITTVDKGEQDDKILVIPDYITNNKKVVKLNKVLKFLHKYKYPDNDSTTIGEVVGYEKAVEDIDIAHENWILNKSSISRIVDGN